MGGPAWLSDAVAAVMVVLAAYCAVRLVIAGARRRETELDSDGMHVVMGAAMAGMLAPRLSLVPSDVWTAVFAVIASWFAWQTFRVWRGPGVGRWLCPYPVPHLAEALAMVYMLTVLRSPGKTGGTAMSNAAMGSADGAARAPELAALFAVFLAGYVAWLGDRSTSVASAPISAGTASAGGGCFPALAPRGACCYKLAMSIGMGYMLILML